VRGGELGEKAQRLLKGPLNKVRGCFAFVGGLRMYCGKLSVILDWKMCLAWRQV
jgi:hypothetical protein